MARTQWGRHGSASPRHTLEARASALLSRRAINAIIVVGGCLLLAAELVLMRQRLAAALRVLSGARPLWVALAAAATIVSMQSFARTQRRMLRAADPDPRTELPLARMVGLTYAANALNMTLPAGSAVSVAYTVNRLREWGSSNAAAVFTVLASGTLSTATFFALALGCGLAAGTSDSSACLPLIGATGAVLGVLAVRHRRTSTARGWLRPALGRVEGGLRRISVRAAEALRDVIDGMGAIRPRRRDWLAATGLAAVNWLADFVCLVASCHAVGMPVSDPVIVLTAYLAGMSASSIAFVPGGFGVIEVAMIAALRAGGVLTTPATAAVLLYRMISCVCVVAAGWTVWSRTALGRLHHRRGAVSVTR